jgi:hypothetical protein
MWSVTPLILDSAGYSYDRSRPSPRMCKGEIHHVAHLYEGTNLGRVVRLVSAGPSWAEHLLPIVGDGNSALGTEPSPGLGRYWAHKPQTSIWRSATLSLFITAV